MSTREAGPRHGRAARQTRKRRARRGDRRAAAARPSRRSPTDAARRGGRRRAWARGAADTTRAGEDRRAQPAPARGPPGARAPARPGARGPARPRVSRGEARGRPVAARRRGAGGRTRPAGREDRAPAARRTTRPRAANAVPAPREAPPRPPASDGARAGAAAAPPAERKGTSPLRSARAWACWCSLVLAGFLIGRLGRRRGRRAGRQPRGDRPARWSSAPPTTGAPPPSRPRSPGSPSSRPGPPPRRRTPRPPRAPSARASRTLPARRCCPPPCWRIEQAARAERRGEARRPRRLPLQAASSPRASTRASRCTWCPPPRASPRWRARRPRRRPRRSCRTARAAGNLPRPHHRRRRSARPDEDYLEALDDTIGRLNSERARRRAPSARRRAHGAGQADAARGLREQLQRRPPSRCRRLQTSPRRAARQRAIVAALRETAAGSYRPVGHGQPPLARYNRGRPRGAAGERAAQAACAVIERAGYEEAAERAGRDSARVQAARHGLLRRPRIATARRWRSSSSRPGRTEEATAADRGRLRHGAREPVPRRAVRREAVGPVRLAARTPTDTLGGRARVRREPPRPATCPACAAASGRSRHACAASVMAGRLGGTPFVAPARARSASVGPPAPLNPAAIDGEYKLTPAVACLGGRIELEGEGSRRGAADQGRASPASCTTATATSPVSASCADGGEARRSPARRWIAS